MFRRLTLACLLTAPALAQIPAFPGAQGFGAHATGGRGGDVYTVTNLNSSGAGSLADGIANAPASGRTIVFAVSGYIHVPGSNLRIVNNKITIAGQTAPGDGIGLRDGTLRITGNNTVVRNLRIRHGKNGGGGDCLNVDSSATNSIIDQVSMQFSTDENISFFNSSLDNFTMQHSLSAWGLESHNAGGLWDLEDGSCHHSLWAHHHTRNPKARPYGLLEWINNVTFDWGIGFIMGDSQTPAPWKANVRGSYFLSPPGRTDNIALEKATVDRNGNPNFSIHLDNCLHDSDGDGLLNGTNKGYSIVAGSEFQAGDPAGANRYVKSATPFAGASGNIAIPVDDPLTAFKIVVSNAGAVRLDATYGGTLRDEVDTLLFNNVVNQQTSRITRESDLPVSNSGFGTLNSTAPPSDTDLDGMPDFWELALGSNPTADDHNDVITNTAGSFFPSGTPSGYTKLEEYLHFLSVPHATVARNTVPVPSSITTDLRKFTSGFSNSPTFLITDIHGGTIQQTGPNVTFTPTVNTSGRGGFNFTVTDSDGSSWTRQFAILVSTTSLPRDIIWIGGNGGNVWDTGTVNWQTNSGSSTTFNDGDNTLFDDRGNASTIPLSGTRLPNSVTITGNQNYRFSGPGSLGVSTTFTKASSSTLTLDTTVTSSAGTFLNGGTTVLNNPATLAGGTIRFTGGSTLNVAHPSNSYFSITPNIEVEAGAIGNINLSQRAELNGSLAGGGTFNIFSPSNLGTEGRVYLDGASAGCTGTVNLSGGATAPGNAGRIAFRANGGSFNGFGNARVHLSGIDLFTTNNSSGNTYAIGELSGDANSRLRSNYLNGGGLTTWSLGTLDTDSEFAGEIMDGITSATTIDKYGDGTLTLSGNNTYTGVTDVHEGTLRVTGSLGATDHYVGSGATLSGSGAVGNLVTFQQGSTVSPGNSPGEAGTLTSANGLEINAATLDFDLSSNPATGNDQIINNAGTLTLRSPGGNLGAHFRFNLTDGYLSPGTYTLIDGGSGTSAPGSPGFTHDLPASTRQNFALQRSGGGSSDTFVRLVVTGSSSDLVWTGSTSTWDIANTTPWTGGAGGDNRFFNLDRVHFADGPGNKTVSLSGSLEAQSVNVSSNSGTYVFTGSGILVGNASLVKSGTGTLSLSGTSSHTYNGGTLINGGVLSLANTTAGLGTGGIELQGGTLQLPNSSTFLDNSMLITGNCAIASPYSGNSTIVDTYTATFSSTGTPEVDLSGVNGILSIKGSMSNFAGTLDFNGGSGMLRLNSGSSANNDVNFGSPTAHFDLGTAGATLNNRNGDKIIELGALSGGPSTWLSGRQSGSGNTSTTYLIGALNLDTCFDGTLSNGGDLSGLDLVKVGGGSLCLGGTSSYPGSILVESGILAIPGSVTITGGTSVSSGASLDLAGGSLTTESLQIAAGATLIGPGTLTGELVNDGLLTCTSGTLNLNGPVVNNGVARLSSNAVLSATGEFINNGVLDLLTANGEIPANLENNGTVIDSSGLKLTGFGITGNDVTLTLVTYEGHSYQLQWSPDLSEGSWTNVGGSVSGDGTEKTFTHVNGAGAPRRFYHLSVAP